MHLASQLKGKSRGRPMAASPWEGLLQLCIDAEGAVAIAWIQDPKLLDLEKIKQKDSCLARRFA